MRFRRVILDKDMCLLLKWSELLSSMLGTDIYGVNDLRNGVYVDSTQSTWMVYTLPEMHLRFTSFFFFSFNEAGPQKLNIFYEKFVLLGTPEEKRDKQHV